MKGEGEEMAMMMSRQGRELQRYSASGSRLVVGCIPYKLSPGAGGEMDESAEVLVISSQKGDGGLMFPKGGWESDETIRQAVCREAREEAGVQGNLERRLGKWRYKSRSHDAYHEAIMFSMRVTEQLAEWPEMHSRRRKWVSIAEAKEGCRHAWMKEALDGLVRGLNPPSIRPPTQSQSLRSAAIPHDY